MCGADLQTASVVILELGSPPRVRSRLIGEPFSFSMFGITSACAEQTSTGSM